MNKNSLAILMASMVLLEASSALTIQLRYDYDSAGFFNAPGAKESLRKVADFYESLLSDELLAIDAATAASGSTWAAVFRNPSDGTQISLSNLVVPANTLVIYAGARNLGTAKGQGGPGGYSAGGQQAWFSLLSGRGQTGALATPATDFGPWGGSIAFDNATATSWNFSSTSPVTGQTPFITIALHEIGHVLGIGTAASWTAKVVSASAATPTFTGVASSAVFGAPVPLQSGGSHWRDDGQCAFPDGYVPSEPKNILSKAYGSFNAPHGFGQIALMDPSTCTAGGNHKVMTDLDLAGLRDVGWQVQPPVVWRSASSIPAAFSWASTNGITYSLQRSTNLQSNSWTSLSIQSGNGAVQQFTPPAVLTSRAFYRLTTQEPVSDSSTVTPPSPALSSRAAVVISDCGCHAGCAH